jgi:hypothetical protein
MFGHGSCEYRIEEIDAYDDEDLIDKLNALGLEGWWLTGIVHEPESHSIYHFVRASDGIIKQTGSHIRRQRPERKPQ